MNKLQGLPDEIRSIVNDIIQPDDREPVAQVIHEMLQRIEPQPPNTDWLRLRYLIELGFQYEYLCLALKGEMQDQVLGLVGLDPQQLNDMEIPILRIVGNPPFIWVNRDPSTGA